MDIDLKMKKKNIWKFEGFEEEIVVKAEHFPGLVGDNSGIYYDGTMGLWFPSDIQNKELSLGILKKYCGDIVIEKWILENIKLIVNKDAFIDCSYGEYVFVEIYYENCVRHLNKI